MVCPIDDKVYPVNINFTAMLYKKPLTKEQAMQKLIHYCRYQERCHSEVKNKLFELGVGRNDHDELIMKLVEENFLDEERFVLAFTIGKFKMKQWGRKKIEYALKEKKISGENIEKAVNQIKERDYMHTLKKLAKEKYTSLKNEQYLIRKKKTMDYLMQKGYEVELVRGVVNALQENNKNHI